MADRELPDEDRLAEVMEEFSRRLDEGDDPDPARLLADHPELADLDACLEGLAAVEEFRTALRARDEEPLHGEATVGHYRVLREVGRGGMGVVYEAVDLRLDRRVALKMIRAGDLAGPEERERFLAEARNAARLQHPNIVQVYEVSERDGVPYLALEFVDGTDLDERLRQAPLEPRQAAELVEVLARAMHFAHERHIVHRDLKPANVLLAHGPTVLAPKITDFGLAKRLDAAAGLTHSGAVMGTPSYMAPEQAAGRLDAVGPAADVYALGAILYEGLTGRPPFRAATAVDTLAQVLREEPVPPRRLQPLVPADLQTVCLKCLSKDIAGRYASADDLADDLARFLRSEPIRARPIRPWARMARWARRNPVVASLGAVALVLAALVVNLAVLRLTDAAATRARLAGRRDEILAENRYAARNVANTILLKFQDLAAAVDRTASDAALRTLLANEDRPGLQRFLEEVSRTDPERGVADLPGRSAFHTWHVLNEDAVLLADAPQGNLVVVGTAFPGRDYFRGALRLRGQTGTARVHVSRVYRSENDGLFKTTLSAVVYARPDGGPVLGVLCATLPTDATLGSLPLNDERRTAVLLGRRDTTPAREPLPAGGTPPREAPEEYLILIHPAYGELPGYARGSTAEVFPAELLRGLPGIQPGGELQLRSSSAGGERTLAAYADPLGARHPGFAGRWLAGLAPVGNTEMAVLVQQRDVNVIEAPTAVRGDVVLAVTSALLLAAAAAGAWYWRRAHAPPPSAPTAAAAPTVTLRPGA